ncbi:hypothetical protein A3Q56_02907 [Intoshia linei]|uniref:Integrase zinc-binding domain-containing protein n=1 Tax=Intoshia linei TaxID=1819745 RepID=A0A177B7F7_9BILA|nr:hypothetical protein A3Q56_02907 [Intoshia linei]
MRDSTQRDSFVRLINCSIGYIGSTVNLITAAILASLNYTPGHLNDTADILSRSKFTNAIVQNADVFNWKHGQSKDTDCTEAVKILSLNKKLPKSNQYYRYEKKLKAENGLLYYSRPNKLLPVIAMSDRLNIINHYHRSNLYCHAGVTKIYNLIRYLYFWPYMYKNLKKEIVKCDNCNTSKIRNHSKNKPMKPVVTTHFGELWQIDRRYLKIVKTTDIIIVVN